MTRNRTVLDLFLAAVLIAALAMLGGCVPTTPGPGGSSDATSTPTPEEQLTQLEPKQVNEYKGEKLGSITDFRENSISGPQQVDVATYRLNVGGNVATPLELTYDQVLELPTYSKVVTLNCVEGWSVKILVEGVKLTDVLQKAGYDEASKVVIFKAVDGYSSSLPMDFVRDNDILLAYEMNGLTLPQARGFPFQVIAEDKWGYKWVKWVEAIDASNDTDFRGYWESRGYDNDATLPSSQ